MWLILLKPSLGDAAPTYNKTNKNGFNDCNAFILYEYVACFLDIKEKCMYSERFVVTKWTKSCLLPCFGTFKIPFIMIIGILVFRPEGQIWNPVRRDSKTYVRRMLNVSRISKNQLNSSTINQS